MESRSSRAIVRIFTAVTIALCLTTLLFAQQDPDPNSPTPVLLTEVRTTRAITVTAERDFGNIDTSYVPDLAFEPGSKVVLFVTNVQLLAGEGASAFRIDVQDANGRRYRFPVLSIEPYRPDPTIKNTYAVTTLLTDVSGYWSEPIPHGDVLVGITWRGLISNRVRLGISTIGGRIKDDPGSVPMPLNRSQEIRSRLSDPGPEGQEYIGYRWSGDRMRFLEQATFGPTAATDARLRRIGLKTWLAEQFEAPYPSAAFPYPNQPLKPANAPADCNGDPTGDTVPDVPLTCFRDTYSMYPLQKWHFQEAFYGDAQLRHRVAWALSQIWVTSGVGIQQSRHMVEYHKILSNNAFGNYRNLMKQMTLSPTMGFYLDMAISTRTNPNENYPRELMQLFTIGLFQLNQDGTLKLDQENNPIPTYDQEGVNNLTKVLTGWTFCSVPASCPNIVAGTVNYIDPMRINNTNGHDLTAKTLLTWPADPNFPPNNTNIPACSNCTIAANITAYANTSMDQALDNIFYHPNVGPFVSKIMIQHMVTSDPTPAYVARVAAVFNDNGLGVRGDMKAVVKAILLDPEARGDAKTDPDFGKLREPVQYATNFLKAFNVRSANALGQSDGVIFQRGEFTGMGQLPYRSPTVFNYFPPDYGIPGTTLLGPEFALMTTGTSIQRQNFINRMVYGNPPVPGGTVNVPNGTSVDFSDLQALAATDPTCNLLLDELNRRMMHSTMSSAMRNTIRTAVISIASTNTLARAQQAVHLIASSSQYQIQR
jgi:uncharacterized protein (DUF1800 family)